MKKRLQLLISVTTLVLLVIGMAAFVTVARRHIDRRLTRQIARDNLTVAKTVANLAAHLPAGDGSLVAALRDLCLSVEPPNSGFICVVSQDGQLVAGPSEDQIPFDPVQVAEIVPDGSAEQGSPGAGITGQAITGLAQYEEIDRVDIVASVSIPGTQLRVMIHQDHRSVRSRSRESALALAVPGSIIAILLAVLAFFVADSIVAAYSRRLVAANERLAASNRERSQLIHLLCHDLKNPVGAIQSAVRMLDKTDPQIAADLIDTSARSALHIIESVRQSEALSTGKHTVHLQPVHLHQSVRTAVDLLGSALETKKMTVDVRIPEDCAVIAEETSLANSVLSNILSNAVKFSERGSRIAVWTNSTDDWVQLRIRDSGIGIPSHVLERIFDPSAQTSRPGTEGEDGTGFGMPLVKQFVESYGGWVSIKSREREESPTEHGTEVCLHLRRAPVMAAGAQTTS